MEVVRIAIDLDAHCLGFMWMRLPMIFLSNKIKMTHDKHGYSCTETKTSTPSPLPPKIIMNGCTYSTYRHYTNTQTNPINGNKILCDAAVRRLACGTACLVDVCLHIFLITVWNPGQTNKTMRGWFMTSAVLMLVYRLDRLSSRTCRSSTW
jgi:hypothetical protein